MTSRMLIWNSPWSWEDWKASERKRTYASASFIDYFGDRVCYCHSRWKHRSESVRWWRQKSRFKSSWSYSYGRRNITLVQPMRCKCAASVKNGAQDLQRLWLKPIHVANNNSDCFHTAIILWCDHNERCLAGKAISWDSKEISRYLLLLSFNFDLPLVND